MSLLIRGIELDWSEVPPRSYLRNIPSLRSLQSLTFDAPVTFFCGENGTGKSTLLEAIAIACGFSPEGGSFNYRFSTFDSHSELHRAVRLIRSAQRPRHGYFLRAESFYNVASKAEEYRDGEPSEVYYARYGGKSLHSQSHGESFLALMQGEFLPGGLYLLDEPEAALSQQRQLALLLELRRLSRADAQFIIASHSPILLGLPDAQILSFDGEAPAHCRYEDTQSYRVTELFLRNRAQLLHALFEEDDHA